MAEPSLSSDATARAYPNQADNARVWDGARAGHYEVWYLTLNHRPSRTGFWIRYTLESPRSGHGEPYAQLWFAAFDAASPARTVALNRRFPIGEMICQDDPFQVAIGGARLRHDGVRGRISGDGHEASWDLAWAPDARTHLLLPRVMYRRGGVGDTTVMSPNLDVAFRGTITVDGRRFELAGEPGCQTHLWGRKHAHAWAWGHCNAFTGRPGVVLETLTAQLEKRGRVLPPLTVLTLRAGGREYRFTEFSDVPFARGGWTIGGAPDRLRPPGDGDRRLYWFRAMGARHKIEGAFHCRADDMVVAPYVDPDGEPSFCSNTEVASLGLTLYERGLFGWRERERLVAEQSAHFELGSRERDAGVVKDHVAL